MSDLTSRPVEPHTTRVAGGARSGTGEDAGVRLVVDGLFLRPGRVGGIEFMLYSLVAALVAARRPTDEVAVLLPAEVDVGERFGLEGVEPITVPAFGNRFSTVERRLPRDRDVALFPNYYTPWTAGWGRGCPSVTVIHDLQFRNFPQNFTPAKRAFQHAAIRHTCRKADRVVSISEFTAGEVTRFRPGVSDRLTVIRNPIDWSRFDHETAPDGHPELEDAAFFLLAAAQYRHKNIATAIEGFRQVRDPRARLVLVGQVPEGLGESRVSTPLPQVRGVDQLGFVPDTVLAWLYRRATAVLLPSLYEGCGLPCAEALGLGTPVLHSGRGALPEVVGSAGVAVTDPLSPSCWAAAMTDALDGRVPRPTDAIVSATRRTHDPQRVGAQYWSTVRDASTTTPR